MQNKPNLPNTQMDITSISTMAYEKKCFRGRLKNKPKQTQSNPIARLRRIRKAQAAGLNGGVNRRGPRHSLPQVDKCRRRLGEKEVFIVIYYGL
jgi:hypothetical protein